MLYFVLCDDREISYFQMFQMKLIEMLCVRIPALGNFNTSTTSCGGDRLSPRSLRKSLV